MLIVSRRYLRAAVTKAQAQVALSVGDLRGVKYEGGQLVFDRQHHDPVAAKTLVSMATGAALSIQFAGTGQPVRVTSDDLDRINQHSRLDLAEADVAVFEDYAAHSLRATKPVRFTQRALEALAAEYIKGRTVLMHHDQRHPIGATYHADVVQATHNDVEASWLRIKWYGVLKDASQKRSQDLMDCRTGVMRYTSIRFDGGNWQYHEDEVSGAYVYWYEIDIDETGVTPLTAIEVSRVGLGAMQGASDALAQSDTRDDDPSDSLSPADSAPRRKPFIIA